MKNNKHIHEIKRKRHRESLKKILFETSLNDRRIKKVQREELRNRKKNDTTI